MLIIVLFFLNAMLTFSEAKAQMSKETDKMTIEYITIFDELRHRDIPIQISYNQTKKDTKVIVLNHGYGVTYKDYSFITSELVQNGFYVLSIQHDLNTDPRLPRTGNIFERRKPLWERGIKNILTVLSYLEKQNSLLDLKKVILIGHSNGGDISMMFADYYPQRVEKIISIDSLRYPFPVKHQIPILSLRAVDTKADAGVLPVQGAKIMTIRNAKHNFMYDAGPFDVKENILKEIKAFLS